MLICGLKLTHDGSVALLDDNQLLFSVEVEKLSNNPRYSRLEDLDLIPRILSDFGYKPDDVDEFVIDGWDGDVNGRVQVTSLGKPAELLVAPYHENETAHVLKAACEGTFSLQGAQRGFRSFFHASAHLTSAYATSPFAVNGEPSMALVWDGGMFPRLYYITPSGAVDNGGAVFPLIGHAYATAGHHFGPWKRSTYSETADDLSVAGKLMAYIALGKPSPEVIAALHEEFENHFAGGTDKARKFRETVGGWGTEFERSVIYLHAFYGSLAKRLRSGNFSDEDVLASVHVFLQELLLDRLKAKIRAWKGDGPWNLTFSGGCGLNIKWNSALRADKLFRNVWVPPFPNDSGAALGTATARLYELQGFAGPLNWHVRSGPALVPTSTVPEGWSVEDCTPAALAALLHESQQPVVVVNGRAELGPRALGGRSIIAAPTSPGMKNNLNQIKGRESYRPVAPLCLVDEAPNVFDPGTPDPHMLFEHWVRPEWREKIPAIMHLDGTARLQTVSRADDPVIEEVLRAYHTLSGIPVLCNTSANYNGSGFFPDVASAIAWGGVDAVWSEGKLYRRSSV